VRDRSYKRGWSRADGGVGRRMEGEEAGRLFGSARREEAGRLFGSARRRPRTAG
jgi:hypothetical protein